MTAFSLGTIWEETVAFMRREAGLLIPVALAVFAPAHVMIEIGMASMAAIRGAPDASPSPLILLTLPGMLLVLFGYMTISHLVTAPGISVAEALSAALRRLPRALAAMMLLFFAIVCVGMVIIIASMVGAALFKVDPRSTGMMNQLMVLIFIPAVIVSIRTMLLPPVLALEDGRPMDKIRRAWALSTGHVWRFAGLFLLILFLGMIAAMIEQFVVGSLIQLLSLVIGDGGLLRGIELVINAGIEAMISLVFGIYLALAYRASAAGMP